MIFLNWVISVFVAVTCVDTAKILGVYPLAWGSHYILGVKLMKGLAEAGHDVTMITPYPTKDIPKGGKWTDVVLDRLDEQFKALVAGEDLLNQRKASNPKGGMIKIAHGLMYVTNATFHHPNTKKLIASGATFDAVIVDQFMNECHYLFGYLFNGHLILASTLGPNPMVNGKVGNPSPISTVPYGMNFSPANSNDMTFIERSKNLFLAMAHYVRTHYYLLPWQNQIIRETFPDAPTMDILYYNVSLILLNSHTSLVDAVPLVPNMIEIGGFHIDPPRKLPNDEQAFLDSAKDGAIYFSLGSALKSKDMPAEKKKMFLDVFRNLKQKVLWKFEDELPEKPDNVLIKSWLPQQDILAHPNMKLFITHGGLLSSTEAIYHGIPVLSIPVFGDQEMNANRAVQGGFGLKLNYEDETFNETTLKGLIEELLYNPKYSENALERSRIYHDRPMTPMQAAVYWVEYVIKHKGAPHLRVAGVGLSWYKYFMVDVLGCLLGALIVLALSIKYLIRFLVRCLIRKIKTNKSAKTKVKTS